MDTLTSSEELLHTIHSVDNRHFIVSHSEVDSLLKRLHLSGVETLEGASPSIESLNFYDDLILVPRHKLDRFRKRYKTLQVLRETDKYVWLCRKEIFKETVEYEPSLYNHQSSLLDKLDCEILEGKMTNRLAKRLLK